MGKKHTEYKNYEIRGFMFDKAEKDSTDRANKSNDEKISENELEKDNNK